MQVGIQIFFLTLLTFQGLSLLGLVSSVFIVGMVVTTQSPKWKYYSDISWFSSVVLLICMTLVGSLLGIALLFFLDTCAV